MSFCRMIPSTGRCLEPSPAYMYLDNGRYANPTPQPRWMALITEACYFSYELPFPFLST